MRDCACDELAKTDAAAVVVTSAHQFPTGAVLGPERRAALIEWAEDERLIIEDDYDAEYRYDRVAVGALQGLAPEHVAYIGSASKRLAPGMRLGWMLTALVADLGADRAPRRSRTAARRRLGSSHCAISSCAESSTGTCDVCGCATSVGARRCLRR